MGSWEDDTLERVVECALETESGMGGSAIDVDVDGGRIRLWGYVRSAAQRERVLSIARNFGGMAEVEDDILITP